MLKRSLWVLVLVCAMGISPLRAQERPSMSSTCGKGAAIGIAALFAGAIAADLLGLGGLATITATKFVTMGVGGCVADTLHESMKSDSDNRPPPKRSKRSQ